MTDSSKEPGTTPDGLDASGADQGHPDVPVMPPSAPPVPADEVVPPPEADPATEPVGDYAVPGASSSAFAGTGPTAAYPTDAFGRPLPAGNYATEYPAAPLDPSLSKETPRRKGSIALIAALAIGALVGGASGAGVTALVLAGQGSGIPVTQADGPNNIVVNNTESVNQITAVAAKASPSVVTIQVASGQEGGTGSGVILSKDGYVLTNTHVVTLDGAAGDAAIEVKTDDGKLYTATIVGTDPISDLAVIKLTDASGLTPITWGDSANLNVGDGAIAIGAPLGLAGTVTDGIVSALNRSITVASSAAPTTPEESAPEDGQNPFFFDYPNQQGEGKAPTAKSSISLPVIQTDAAINPGNSGGALLNADGELIGINVAIASAGGSSSAAGSIGVGFSIPSNFAKRVSEELISDGKASHGLLGASVSTATSENSSTVGALINEVSSGGAAADAGLKKGDVVTNFNGVPITDAIDLTAQVRVVAGGADAELTYVRDGESVTVTVTLGELTS